MEHFFFYESKINKIMIHNLQQILNNDIMEIITQFIQFQHFITLIKSSYQLKIIENDKIWKNLCITFKNNFYWELASMRNQSDGMIKCDKFLSWKQQLKSIYNYEKITDIYSQTDTCYYTLWIWKEINIKQFVTAAKMINKLYSQYQTLIIKNITQYIHKFKNNSPLIINYQNNYIPIKQKKNIIIQKTISFIKDDLNTTSNTSHEKIKIKIDLFREVFDSSIKLLDQIIYQII